MSPMTTADVAITFAEQVRGLTRTEYESLATIGALADAKVELLRGVIVEMSPAYRAHGLAVQWLTMWFAKRVPDDIHVRVQSSWAATKDSEPEPDVAVVTADWFSHETGANHPQHAKVLIEVASSSRLRDLGVKAEIYAEASIEQYWVVDLTTRELVEHTVPVNGRYARVKRLSPPATVSAAGVEVPLQDLFDFTFPDGWPEEDPDHRR